MHHSKLFQLLRTLEASELRWLHKFLKSPYHNSNPQYLRLFEYIKKYYPNLEHPKLSREITYKKLFNRSRTLPKASDSLLESDNFDPQKMRKLMHELAVLVEEFLVIHHIKNNAFEHQKIFIAELGRRNHYKAFEKETNSLLHELEQQEKRGENHFLERYQLRKQLFGHALTVRGKESEGKLLKMSEDLDYYFFQQKLKLDIALKSNQRIYATKSQISFIRVVQQAIEERNTSLPEGIVFYNAVDQLFTQKNNPSNFDGLLIKYVAYHASLDDITKSEILHLLIGYTFSEIRKGNMDFVRKQLELYKIGLKENVLIPQNRITNGTFLNIVSCGAFLKEFEWTTKFILEKSEFLEQDIRAEIVALTTANLNFKQGKFKESLEYLINIYFTNILYLTSAKVLLIQCYFELFLEDHTFFELLMAQTNSFEKLLRREQEMNLTKKQQFLNFTLLLRKIAKIIVEQKEIEAIFQELEATSPVVSKPWLKQKLLELKERRAINSSSLVVD